MKPPAFSALTVCGLDELEGHGAWGVSHVLSILDPDWPEPAAFEAFGPHFRATFRFHDAIEAAPGVVLPKKTDVEAILAFGRDAGEISHLLIHCHAGVSRSTAATLMILAQAHARSKRGLARRLALENPAASLAELSDGRLRRRAPGLQRAAYCGARPSLRQASQNSARTCGGDAQGRPWERGGAGVVRLWR
jgi:predicted protein tyrosine phosphatase